MLVALQRISVLVLVSLATMTATAAAGVPAAPAGSTPTTGPATPLRGSAQLYLIGVFKVKGQSVTVPYRGVRVDGVVRPYVAGQKVTVRVFLGRRVLLQRLLDVRPSPGGTYGRFTLRIASPHQGTVRVSVTHALTPQQRAFHTEQRLSALDQHVGFGSRGRFVLLVQQRLAALHFYIPRTGVYDSGTGLAVDAYHRLLGWGFGQTLGPATVNALLNGQGQFRIRHPHHGHHAEGDLRRQLLALADGPNVQLIFPISSGKDSTPTVLGDYQIYQRTPGYLPDGMFFSSFFVGGYAIHGYDPAPDYPASHGCMRLPIQDAVAAYNWLHLGNWVDVYL